MQDILTQQCHLDVCSCSPPPAHILWQFNRNTFPKALIVCELDQLLLLVFCRSVICCTARLECAASWQVDVFLEDFPGKKSPFHSSFPTTRHSSVKRKDAKGVLQNHWPFSVSPNSLAERAPAHLSVLCCTHLKILFLYKKGGIHMIKGTKRKEYA